MTIREPDAQVLARALETAGAILDRDVRQDRWRVVARLDRWGSTLFRI